MAIRRDNVARWFCRRAGALGQWLGLCPRIAKAATSEEINHPMTISMPPPAFVLFLGDLKGVASAMGSG